MNRIEWAAKLVQYETSSVKKIIWQIASAFVPYLALLTIMFFMFSNGYPYGAVLAFSPLAALFLVKIFIILHDCCHKSYLKGSPVGCFILGHICGVFTFTSFFDFRQSHVIHHATVANLDKRGIGDIWTMTAEEYRLASSGIKFVYRVFRNPLFLFIIAPPLKFILTQRFPNRISRRKELLSIFFTDFMITLIILVAHFTIGINAYIAVQLPVICIASTLGVGIFYINHQFENAYWARDKECNRIIAALRGSSFYKFPGILAWFTDSIEYHHIHHLNFRIPNYNLKRCYEDIDELHKMKPLILRDALRSMFLALWDERTEKLISFSTFNKLGKNGSL
jgi:omega-6 fatty acid desaturase (delta-12 desaturase)